MFIGIDVGLKGGISLLKKTKNNKEKYSFYEMPLKNNTLNIEKVIEILTPFKNKGICYIEKSQAMPNQGVVSMFNYGKSYGVLIGILSVLNIEIVEVSPLSWKKHFNLFKKTKEDSVLLAEKYCSKENWRTKRGRLLDGKAESFLILKYGMEKITNI